MSNYKKNPDKEKGVYKEVEIKEVEIKKTSTGIGMVSATVVSKDTGDEHTVTGFNKKENVPQLTPEDVGKTMKLFVWVTQKDDKTYWNFETEDVREKKGIYASTTDKKPTTTSSSDLKDIKESLARIEKKLENIN